MPLPGSHRFSKSHAVCKKKCGFGIVVLTPGEKTPAYLLETPTYVFGLLELNGSLFIGLRFLRAVSNKLANLGYYRYVRYEI